MLKKILLCTFLLFGGVGAFAPRTIRAPKPQRKWGAVSKAPTQRCSPTTLNLADFDQISLAASQENAGLAVVVVGESIYSFAQAPGFLQALIVVPAFAAAYVLFTISGPPLDVADINMMDGLTVAALVSVGLMATYGIRLALPSRAPKEYAFGGLIIAFLGFASFTQNMFAGGWLVLPSLPTLPSLPSLPF